jgi:hypothetical protein
LDDDARARVGGGNRGGRQPRVAAAVASDSPAYSRSGRHAGDERLRTSGGRIPRGHRIRVDATVPHSSPIFPSLVIVPMCDQPSRHGR